MDSQKLQGLLQDYKTHSKAGSVELEIGISNVTRETFANVFEKVRDSSKLVGIELMFDFIYDKPGMDTNNLAKSIKSIRFNLNCEKVESVFYDKKRLTAPVIISSGAVVPYVVRLSSETTINDFVSLSNPLVRVKVRASFEFGTWRIDMTQVKTADFTAIKKIADELKRKLFKGRNVTNFLDIDPSEVDAYEIEIEHVDTSEIGRMRVEDLDIVGKLWGLVDGKYIDDLKYQAAIYRIAQHIISSKSKQETFLNPENRIKKLANSVVSLTKRSYAEINPPEGFYIAPKLDGTHIMGLVESTTCIVLGEKYREFVNPDKVCALSIFDGEYVSKNNTLYIFDVMRFDGRELHTEPFTTRFEYLPEIVRLVGEMVGKDKNAPLVEMQAYSRISGGNLRDLVTGILEESRNFDIDGIIFTEPSENYQNTRNFKYKELKHNTIDFLAIQLPEKYINVYPYVARPGKTIHVLFCGISGQMFKSLGLIQLGIYKELIKSKKSGEGEKKGWARDAQRDYFATHFVASSNPHAYIYYHDSKAEPVDGHIIELAMDVTKMDWVFNRIRTDRVADGGYFGNDFRIAELTYINYVDIFEVSDLWAISLNPEPMEYKSVVDFRASALRTAVNNYASGTMVVVCPRGMAEIPTKVSAIIYVDSDPRTIANIIAGKYASEQTANVSAFVRNYGPGAISAVGNILTCINGFDSFCDSFDHLAAFMAGARENVQSGGFLVLSFIDGAKIFTGTVGDLGDRFKVDCNAKATKFTGIAQTATIVDGGEPHTINLVSVEKVTEVAKLNGFKLIENKQLTDYGSKKPFSEDAGFIDLFRVLIFKAI
jgi:hypothetical protein